MRHQQLCLRLRNPELLIVEIEGMLMSCVSWRHGRWGELELLWEVVGDRIGSRVVDLLRGRNRFWLFLFLGLFRWIDGLLLCRRLSSRLSWLNCHEGRKGIL